MEKNPQKPICCDWSPHTCLRQHRSLCFMLSLLCFKLLISFTSTSNIDWNYANMWHGDVMMSGSHGIKGGSTDDVFQEQCFLCEWGVVLDLGLLTMKLFYVHKNCCKTLKESKNNTKLILQSETIDVVVLREQQMSHIWSFSRHYNLCVLAVIVLAESLTFWPISPNNPTVPGGPGGP